MKFFEKKIGVFSLFFLVLGSFHLHCGANFSLPIADIIVSDIRQDSLPDSTFLRNFRKHETTYENLLDKADKAYRRGLMKRAKKFYTQAAALNPYSVYIRDRLESIRNYRFSFKNILFGIDFDKPGLLIKTLIWLVIFFTVSMIVLLVFILFHRTHMERKEKFRQHLRELYQELLVDFLFSDDNTRNIPEEIGLVAGSPFNRHILTDQMIDLSINLTGETKTRLRDLFISLSLHHDSVRKALSRKWYIKIKGFRELAFMDIADANDEIVKCLRHKNDIVRMEAQLAMVRLNPADSFGFLDYLEKNFTIWEQLTIYETMIFHNLEIPKFDQWLFLKNKSVVLFALQMIDVFKQTETYPNLFWMLVNEDDEIRNQTIRVIGNLKIKEALPHLKRLYKNETYANCLAIIKAMAKMPEESMLNFLKLVVDKEDDVQLQIEAAIAIHHMGETGKTALNKMMNSDYKNYQIIIKHVLDKRIN